MILVENQHYSVHLFILKNKICNRILLTNIFNTRIKSGNLQYFIVIHTVLLKYGTVRTQKKIQNSGIAEAQFR